MKNSQTNDTYHNKARAKEICMFIFACAVLVLSIVFLLLPTGIDAEKISDLSAEQTIPGAAVLALYVNVIVGIILSVALAICWVVGLIVSVRLVFRKNILPRWMHISSIVLTSCYFISISTLALLWIVS